MAYLTTGQFDLYSDARHDELSNDADGIAATASVITEALDWASAGIDIILSAGAAVTVANLSAAMQLNYKMWTAQLADLFLFRRKPGMLTPDEMRDAVKAIQKDIGRHQSVATVGSQSQPHTRATYNNWFGAGLQGYVPASDGAEVNL